MAERYVFGRCSKKLLLPRKETIVAITHHFVVVHLFYSIQGMLILSYTLSFETGTSVMLYGFCRAWYFEQICLQTMLMKFIESLLFCHGRTELVAGFLKYPRTFKTISANVQPLTNLFSICCLLYIILQLGLSWTNPSTVVQVNWSAATFQEFLL